MIAITDVKDVEVLSARKVVENLNGTWVTSQWFEVKATDGNRTEIVDVHASQLAEWFASQSWGLR